MHHTVAPICTDMLGTAVAARLLSVLAADRLLVAAYPWPGMEMVVIVRIRPDIPQMPGPAADPTQAEQDSLILE